MGYPLVPRDLLSVALHPCVAAYPVATVAMERLIVSRNETVVEGQSNTIAMSTTKTTTTTKSWEVGGEFSVAPPKPPAVLGGNLCVTGDNECVNNVIAPNFFGAFLGSIMSGIGSGFKISSKYANSTQTSTAVQNSSSDTWTKQISINTAETGYMNANVRFINTGTAPIRNAAPTINIVINETDHSGATVRANNNTISDYLPADGSYPAKGLSPISFTQASSTGAVKMPLNYEQITLLDAGTYTLGLQTPQVTGDYQVMVDGRPVTKQSWADFRGQIDGATATLVLFDSANADTSSVNLYERKVAARRNSPEDTTPELTLREGILLAFDMKFDRGYFVYKNRYFDDFSMHIIIDTQTGKEIQRQLDNNQISSIYDVKLRPDMNFTISLPSWVCDFDYSTKPWYYAGTGNYGYMGKGALTTYSSGWTQNVVPLEPNTQYSLRAIVKTDRTTPTKVQLGLTDAISKRTGPYLEIDVANSWKFEEMTFTTDLHPERYAYIFFRGLNSQKIYFDSVSIAKFDEMELKPSKVLWVSRQDGQSIDLTNQTAFTIPSNYEDSAGKNGLDLIFIDKETGEPLDMRDYDIVRSDIKILSDTTTSDAYKIKGHVNLNILAKGTTVLSVRQKRSKKLLKQFVVTSNVSPTSPHFVKKWHASGHSWKTKTKGNYPYAVGFNWSWNGYKAQAQEYIESYTVQLNGSSKRRTFPFSDVDKYTSGFYFYKSNNWSYDWALSKNGLMELTANMKDGSKLLGVQKWYWF
ncbi:hypothetical protein [Bacillus thuringiensis]|nr:hypothetical protein [Bacillus thuringiensis]